MRHALAEQRDQRPLAAGRLWEAALEDAQRALYMRERLGVAEEDVIDSSRRLVRRLERRDLER